LRIEASLETLGARPKPKERRHQTCEANFLQPIELVALLRVQHCGEKTPNRAKSAPGWRTNHPHPTPVRSTFAAVHSKTDARRLKARHSLIRNAKASSVRQHA
jgi:hypothetical protein